MDEADDVCLSGQKLAFILKAFLTGLFSLFPFQAHYYSCHTYSRLPILSLEKALGLHVGHALLFSLGIFCNNEVSLNLCYSPPTLSFCYVA